MRILALLFTVIFGEFLKGTIIVSIDPAIKTQLALNTVNNSGALEPAMQRWYDYTSSWLNWGFLAVYIIVFVWAIWPIVKPNKEKE